MSSARRLLGDPLVSWLTDAHLLHAIGDAVLRLVVCIDKHLSRAGVVFGSPSALERLSVLDNACLLLWTAPDKAGKLCGLWIASQRRWFFVEFRMHMDRYQQS
jgi:hypothetical protein